MKSFIVTALSLPAGVLLGLIFFAGLWITVRKGLPASMPVYWFLPSFLLRTGIVLLGFRFLGQERWENLLLCGVGFLAGRFMVLRFTRRAAEMIPDSCIEQEKS
ncbi:MAG TPA: ATP synthase subunit I [Puia sp.]|nr:ATP synthase subunit I [Puia sp.]